jgi:hypothetical protein
VAQRGFYRLSPGPGAALLSHPITGITFCCARSKDGHTLVDAGQNRARLHSITS